MIKFSYQVSGQVFEIELEKTPRGYRARANGTTQEIEIGRAVDGEFSLRIDGQPHTTYFAMNGVTRFVAYEGKTYTLTAATRRAARHDSAHAHSDEDAIRAPMPGQVRGVQAKAGDVVERGQTLLILEAMKMEIKVQSPRAGRIAKILVKPGELVEREQVVAEIESVVIGN
jgi:biotin carboxyl carrier protein